MAISVATLDSGVDLTITTTPKVTNPFTAAANRVILVTVALINGTTGRTATVTGTGLSFTKAEEFLWDSNSDSLSIHWALSGGSGFSGTLTITQNNSIQQMHWGVFEISGANTTTPIPQTAGQGIGVNSTYAANTLGSPVSSDSRSFIQAGHHTFEDTLMGSGVTELIDVAGNSPATGWAVGWSNTAWQAALTMTGTSGTFGAQAWEIAAAPVSVPAPPPRRPGNTLLAR